MIYVSDIGIVEIYVEIVLHRFPDVVTIALCAAFLVVADYCEDFNLGGSDAALRFWHSSLSKCL